MLPTSQFADAVQQISRCWAPTPIVREMSFVTLLRRARVSGSLPRDGRPPTIGVYIVRDGEIVWYVGATTRGVHTRIAEHVRDRTPLGRVAEALGTRADGWTVEMLPADSRHEVFALESQTILRLDPVLNVCR
jgi:hypothetical protein